MNFKRMNFLLIMLALVLLVGIGSVSAASDDGTDIISDGITDDMLLDDGVTEGNDPADPDPTDPGDSTETEKVNTTVESEDVTARDNETASISVTVKDNESQEISVSENNFSVSEGNTSINFTYNDNKINLTQKLGLGNHTLIIAYLGNDIYAASNTTITLSIFGNKTMNVPENVSVNDTKTVEIPIEVTNGVNATSLDSTNTNVTLFYKDGEGNYQNKSIELNEGQIIFTEENSLVSAYLIINYNDGEFDLNETVNIKIQTVIEAIPVSQRVNENEEVNITVALSDIYDSVELTEDNLTVYEGNKSIGFTYADGKITLSEALSAGNHTLTIAYKGSHDYADSSADVDISIIGDWRIELQDLTAIDENNNATLTINITNSVDYLEVAVGELSLNLTYVNASGDINTVTINDFIISGNVIEFNVPSDFTSGNLTVVYNETSNNLLANATVKTGTIITSENVTSLANDTFSFKINNKISIINIFITF